MATYSDINSNLNSKNQDIIIDEDVQAIENSINNILLLDKYEVPGRPELGAGLRKYLFEIADDITSSAIEDDIRENLLKWESRISFIGADVEFFKGEQMLTIDLFYRLSNETTQRLLKIVVD